MSTSMANQTDGEPQENFVEHKDPTELVMCLILASAYLGLAKFCWQPLLKSGSWKMLFNVEGFFLTIALLAILVGLRPYLSPSSLQISPRGVKYRGPYWPQRRTVNWDQVVRIYLSPELVIILYKRKLPSTITWPMLIPTIYLAERDRISKTILKWCPIDPVHLTSPAIFSRVVLILIFLGLVIWILELLIS